MRAALHPTAVISEKARLGQGVEVGPYSVIGPEAVIGDGTVIANNVLITGRVWIGERNLIGAGSTIGTPAQIKNFRDIRNAGVRIGSDNVIRENVSINQGSTNEAETVIGDRNFFMIGAHVAHDCRIGHDTVIANSVLLAGYVTVEDGAVIGGGVGIHQHTRVGRLAMIGGLARVVMDVPPFSLCSNNPAAIFGPNSVGLKRAGFNATRLNAVKAALRTILDTKIILADALKKVESENAGNADIAHLIDFVRRSKRGIHRAAVSDGPVEE